MRHSCNPNVKARYVPDLKAILLYVNGNLKRGTELTFDWGLTVTNKPNRVCQCGGRRCCGVMDVGVDWEKIQVGMNRNQPEDMRLWQKAVRGWGRPLKAILKGKKMKGKLRRSILRWVKANQPDMESSEREESDER